MIAMGMRLSFPSNIVLKVFGDKMLEIILIHFHIVAAALAHDFMHFLIAVQLNLT